MTYAQLQQRLERIWREIEPAAPSRMTEELAEDDIYSVEQVLTDLSFDLRFIPDPDDENGE